MVSGISSFRPIGDIAPAAGREKNPPVVTAPRGGTVEFAPSPGHAGTYTAVVKDSEGRVVDRVPNVDRNGVVVESEDGEQSVVVTVDDAGNLVVSSPEGAQIGELDEKGEQVEVFGSGAHGFAPSASEPPPGVRITRA